MQLGLSRCTTSKERLGIDETNSLKVAEVVSSGHIWLKAPDPIPNSEVKQP